MIVCDRCGNKESRHYRVTVAETEPPPPPGTTPEGFCVMGRPESNLEIPMDLCLACRSALPESLLKLLLSPPSTASTTTVVLTTGQAATLVEAKAKCRDDDPMMTDGRCVQLICTEWLRAFKEKE